jgi:hypothetical protein
MEGGTSVLITKNMAISKIIEEWIIESHEESVEY